MGIVNTEDTQIVFSDTPGVLKPNYKMQEMMLQFSESALADADILLYVTDVVEDPEKNMDFLEKVSKMLIPVILLINKIDESDQKTLGKLVTKWHGLLPNAEILPISAKNKFGVDILLKRVHELLPESPAFFDKDQLTDKPAKFFVSEIIREKILRYYDKEIPYSVEVVVLKNDVVSGVVVNWTPVLREGLHVDPLNIMSKCVIDGTGHDSEICKVVARKNGIQLDTVTGGVVGEKSLDVAEGERMVVEGTREIYAGLYVCGMASSAVAGTPRMGPIFGGMLLSGKKVADLIIDKLKK